MLLFSELDYWTDKFLVFVHFIIGFIYLFIIITGQAVFTDYAWGKITGGVDLWSLASKHP